MSIKQIVNAEEPLTTIETLNEVIHNSNLLQATGEDNGVNLFEKFADEIADYSDGYAWLKARIQAGNFEGINLWDYFLFPLSAGTIGVTTTYSIAAKTMNAHIIGINTYKNYGDTAVGNHIDFCTDSTFGTTISWNPSNNNNGTTANPSPWKASMLYALLNGTNNANKSTTGTDASNKGIWQLMPQALRNVIIQKRFYGATRQGTSTLTESNSGEWHDRGNLWVPTEKEVYGCASNTNKDNWDFEGRGSIPYPAFFANNRRILGRAAWWLSSVSSGSSAYACFVGNHGFAFANNCTSWNISAPVCFRIG